MEDVLRVGSAGNVQNPALLVLVSMGYELSCNEVVGTRQHVWKARQGNAVLSAESPLELLGLCVLFVEGEARLGAGG